jgi:hypothetical protein
MKSKSHPTTSESDKGMFLDSTHRFYRDIRSLGHCVTVRSISSHRGDSEHVTDKHVPNFCSHAQLKHARYSVGSVNMFSP